jgi:hypothetical protein
MQSRLLNKNSPSPKRNNTMKWRNSDTPPNQEGRYFIKDSSNGAGVLYFRDGEWWWGQQSSKVGAHLRFQWLDESEPSPTTIDENELQREAEALFPFNIKNNWVTYSYKKHIDGLQRAYIEGRKVNIERIESLETWIKEARELIDDFWCAVPTDSDWCKDMEKNISRVSNSRDGTTHH